MMVANSKGVHYYPYTQLKNKRVYYSTRLYPINGARERKRRVRQLLNQSPLGRKMREARHDRKIKESIA